MFQSGQYNVTVTNGDEVILPLKSETYTGGEQQTITVWVSLESGSVLRSTDPLTAGVSVSSQYGSEKASVKCNLIGNASRQYIDITYCYQITMYTRLLLFNSAAEVLTFIY